MKLTIEKHTINYINKNNIEFKKDSLSNVQRSKLITSIITGIYSPVIILEELNYNKFNSLTNCEELSTIIEFLRGNFSIEENIAVSLLSNKNLISKTFFDFTEEEKDSFLENSITIFNYRNLSEKERKLVSDLYNRGGNNIKINILEEIIPRVDNNTTKIDLDLEKILKHEFFNKINANISSDLILLINMISVDGAISDFSGKQINEFKCSLEKVPDNQELFNYLNNSFIENTNYLKRAHIPVIAVCANIAINKKIPCTKFKEIIDAFYSNIPQEYKDTCNSRSSAKSQINKRLNILLSYFNSNI